MTAALARHELFHSLKGEMRPAWNLPTTTFASGSNVYRTIAVDTANQHIVCAPANTQYVDNYAQNQQFRK
jgi:hypothetical protein